MCRILLGPALVQPCAHFMLLLSTYFLLVPAQLLQFLETFRDKTLRRLADTDQAVNDLVSEAKEVDVGIQNALNRFNMLAHTQFIENVRVLGCTAERLVPRAQVLSCPFTTL